MTHLASRHTSLVPGSVTVRSAIAWIAAQTRTRNAGEWLCEQLGGGFILAYHDLPADTFERQMEALKPNEPVHLSELIERARNGRRTAGLFAVTFDDGVGATVRAISAVCKRRHWPVTFYLPTLYLDEGQGLPFQLWHKLAAYLPSVALSLPSGPIDLTHSGALAQFKESMGKCLHTQPRDRYQPLLNELAQWLLEHGLTNADQLRPPEPISWPEVADLSRHEAIRFESHGVTHTAVVALSPAMLEDELKVSKRRISDHTNRECRHFCYPFGGTDSIGHIAPRIVSQVYASATTMARGRLRHHPWSMVPRIPIYDRDDPAVVRLKLLTV